MGIKVFENGFGDNDYWLIADVIKGIYTSDGSMAVLLDFERVLDELDIYSYKNWRFGELVEGPDVSRYTVTCIFSLPGKSRGSFCIGVVMIFSKVITLQLSKRDFNASWNFSGTSPATLILKL